MFSGGRFGTLELYFVGVLFFVFPGLAIICHLCVCFLCLFVFPGLAGICYFCNYVCVFLCLFPVSKLKKKQNCKNTEIHQNPTTPGNRKNTFKKHKINTKKTHKSQNKHKQYKNKTKTNTKLSSCKHNKKYKPFLFEKSD